MKPVEKRLGLLLLLLILIGVSGCESVFTYSPISALRRNPANLDTEAQAVLAQEAINSGDPEAIAEVYEAIRDTDDPALLPLATDLAISVSGVPQVLTDVLGQVAALDMSDPSAIEAIQDSVLQTIDSGIDRAAVDEAVALLERTEAAGAAPTSDQYAMAAIGLVAKVVAEIDDASVLVGGDDSAPTLTAEQQADITKAEELVSASGLSLSELGFPL